MDEPELYPQPDEISVDPREVWPQLDAEQQARVIRLLSQMAYGFIAAQAELCAEEEESDGVPSSSPPEDTPSTS